MAPAGLIQPTDDTVSRSRRKLHRAVIAYDKAAAALCDTLNRDDAEQDDAEIQMDQVQLVKDEAFNTFDDLIEMFEKAPITDDNDKVIADLETDRREKQFLWLRVTRDFDKKFFPKKKPQAEETEEEEA